MPYVCLLVPRLRWGGSKLRKRSWESATQCPCPAPPRRLLRRTVVAALVSCWKTAALPTRRAQPWRQRAQRQVKRWDGGCWGPGLALLHLPAVCCSGGGVESPLSRDGVALLVQLPEGKNPRLVFHILIDYFYLKIKINLVWTSAVIECSRVYTCRSRFIRSFFPFSPNLCLCHSPGHRVLAGCVTSSELESVQRCVGAKYVANVTDPSSRELPPCVTWSVLCGQVWWTTKDWHSPSTLLHVTVLRLTRVEQTNSKPKNNICLQIQ